MKWVLLCYSLMREQLLGFLIMMANVHMHPIAKQEAAAEEIGKEHMLLVIKKTTCHFGVDVDQPHDSHIGEYCYKKSFRIKVFYCQKHL